MFVSRFVFSSRLFVLLSPLAFLVNGQQVAVKLSPADARIAVAQARVKASAKSFEAYNALAAALCRKGRDTSEVAVYDQAEAALSHALQLSKANDESLKLQVRVLLGKHEFAPALKLATELNKRTPDDLTIWASLVDANIALGNYGEAERQAQWVLDLRPGNTLGFEKAAELRELFGDVPGAVECLDDANRRTPSNDTDQHAWLFTQKARLQLASGYDREAEASLQQALQLFPESQLAAEVLAQIRLAQGKLGEAAALFEKRYQVVKSASNLYEWAEALEKSGQKDQAEDAFKSFETQARAESTKPVNANLQLISFDLEYRHNAAAALALATAMSSDHHDTATFQAYAWALYCNGKYAEAKAQMDRALAVGYRDSIYFCHAALIAAKAGDTAAATTYQKGLAAFKGGVCPGVQTTVAEHGATGEASR